MAKAAQLSVIERRFLDAVKHHIQGWKTKIENDFGHESYVSELKNLQSDPVYSKFGFDIPEYVLVRLIGRMSISVGRRLGEIYDKLPRFVAAARFNVTPQQVAEKFDGLELDIGLRYSLLSEADIRHVKQVVSNLQSGSIEAKGVGIEIRYNFNPNDSSSAVNNAECRGLPGVSGRRRYSHLQGRSPERAKTLQIRARVEAGRAA